MRIQNKPKQLASGATAGLSKEDKLKLDSAA